MTFKEDFVMKSATPLSHGTPHLGSLILGILVLAVGFGCAADKTDKSADSSVSDTTNNPGDDALGDVSGLPNFNSADGDKSDQSTPLPSPDTTDDEMDDDGDGLTDQEEAVLGTDALLADTDSDGFDDGNDSYPLDASEHIDSDADGVGDNADAFPLDSTETLDTDGDALGTVDAAGPLWRRGPPLLAADCAAWDVPGVAGPLSLRSAGSRRDVVLSSAPA